MAYRRVRRTAYFPEDARGEGIDIAFSYRDQMISVGGWYDTMVGIEPSYLTLRAFLDRLDVRLEDVQKAFAATPGGAE